MDRHRSRAPGTKAAPAYHEEESGLLQQWPGIEDLIHEALMLPPDQRDAYLTQVCGADKALRREILSLIKADERAGDFLVHPIMALHVSAEAEPERRFPPSTVLADRYRIVRFLGRGGMGEVYRADDLKLDEPVALKFLPTSLAQDDAVLSRFVREVKVARRVTHPNVCRVFDIGEGDGHHFLSMEFIDGEDLSSRLRRFGRLPTDEAMEILRQVCRGLAAIHDQGILHCDLKPANLLTDGQGRTRITDFGIARLAGRVAGAKSCEGTPAYMAPEQHAGEEVSTATDIYALGLVAYELSTGQRAFRGSAAELSRLHCETPPRAPSSLVADLDLALERVILRCLAKDPRERPASVADVETALARGNRKVSRKAGLDISRGIQALRQLPTPPADFTGRTAELNELRTAVKSSGVTISGLQGMGGVGKTTLALKLAEELAPHYPDAHIYLDLRGTSPDPLTPSQAMAHVIRAYYPAAPLPGSEEGMAAHYQSVLHGRRALILMDNAAGREQVERLIPPRSCLMMVTSRRYFALPGLVTKSLDSLPPEDAAALLRRIAPRIGEEADEIARLCGYLPIALRLAGGTLAVRPDLSPADYARRLAKGKGRLELIEASLGLSYELLSCKRQTLWRALAVFPGTFDRAAAAAVWDLDSERADSHLGELVRDGLVEWVDGRYRLHDLARCFAESRLDEGESAEFRRRHARHYMGVLEDAENLYLQGGENVRNGLGLLDREWANIEAGQSNSEADPAMAAACSTYPQAGSHCHWLRLSLPAVIRWNETALASARRLGDRRAEGRHLGRLGRAFAAAGDSHRAVELGKQAVEVAREIGDRRGEGIHIGFLGETYYFAGELRRALKLFERAVALSRKAGDRRKEGVDLACLAGVYSDLGERSRAVELYEEALVVVREVGNRYGESGILSSLGFTVATLGEHRRAVELYERALLLARGVGYRPLECHILDNLADAYTDLGAPSDAIDMANRARAIADEIRSRRHEGHILTTMGRAFRAIGYQQRAIELLEQSRGISREIGDSRMEGLASWYLGLIHEETGQLDLAAALMQVRVDYERAVGSTEADHLAARLEEIRARSAV